ncbi:MAG: hypothetical protein JST63_01315 [Bacteroidetes bacterium]|nr:hypothetical protein [Bacteroidota bacterium]
MNQSTTISPISTILQINQELEVVKHTLHEMLADEMVPKEKNGEHISSNSFMLGWVKSFTIVMISITLHKASDNTTNIFIEALDTHSDNKGMRIVRDGFYDFIYFFRRNLLPDVKTTEVAVRNEHTVAWGWLFFILFIILIAWYLLFK